MLPVLPLRTGVGRLRLGAFGGLDRRAGAAPGAISAMENLTGADAPALSTRPARKTLRALHGAPHGLCAAGDRLLSAEGTGLYVDGVAAPGQALADSDKAFAVLGRRVLIFPDKVCWTAEDGLQPLEASYTAAGLVFSDGTYAGEPAEKNTVTTAGDPFPFRAGDGVTIPACAPTGGVEKTAVVREVSGDGRTLRFSENCFAENGTVSETLTLARTVPDLDFLCVNENRVWGCRGDVIACCKLGDVTNWNVFDGLSTDAWQGETGTAGDFTACVSFLGYPVFFKADRIFKVYGSRPSNFEVLASAAQGVASGAAASAATAGESLYYLSPAGFVRYGGGFPGAVDAPLDAHYTAAVGGGDGRRYFVSALRSGGARELLSFDPQTGLWHREDDLAVHSLCRCASALYAQSEQELLCLSDPAGAVGGTAETDFTGSVTVSDIGSDSFQSRYGVRLWLELENAGAMAVEASFDGGAFQTVATLPASAPGRAAAVGVPIRRCRRLSLRLSGGAPWTLRALEIETRTERKNRKEG